MTSRGSEINGGAEVPLNTIGTEPHHEISLAMNAGLPDEPLPADSGEGSASVLLPLLQFAWQNRRLFLRGAVCAVALSTVIAFLIPARYTSVTRLMPPEERGGAGLLAALFKGSGTTSALTQGLASDLLGGNNSGALFAGILTSETVLDAVIHKFDLQKLYGAKKIEDARKQLKERTVISVDRKSGIISVEVTDWDPQRAAAMGQTYVSELDRLVAQVSTSAARRERIFLGDRLEKVKGDLDAAARQFSIFASANTAIDIPAQGKAMVEAAAELQGQLIAAQAELTGLQQIYSANNIRVKTATARVAELQKKLNEVGGEGTPGQLSKENTLYPSIRKLPLLGVTYADLYRSVKIQETVFELLTQQYELAKVEEAKEIPSVKVLVPPTVPTKKSYPPRGWIIAGGTLAGLLLLGVWIVGEARWNATPDTDPAKMFAREVFVATRRAFPRGRKRGAPKGEGNPEPWIFDAQGERTRSGHRKVVEVAGESQGRGESGR